MVFIFQFVNMVHHIEFFGEYWKNPCIPGIKAHLAMVYDLFNMLLDSVCQNFVKDFSIYVHR